MNFEEFIDIIGNKFFVKSAKKIYNSSLPYKVRDVKDIISNLFSDPIKNLELIIKYMAAITLATRGMVRDGSCRNAIPLENTSVFTVVETI
jgi:hypothetical protein